MPIKAPCITGSMVSAPLFLSSIFIFISPIIFPIPFPSSSLSPSRPLPNDNQATSPHPSSHLFAHHGERISLLEHMEGPCSRLCSSVTALGREHRWQLDISRLQSLPGPNSPHGRTWHQHGHIRTAGARFLATPRPKRSSHQHRLWPRLSCIATTANSTNSTNSTNSDKCQAVEVRTCARPVPTAPNSRAC